VSVIRIPVLLYHSVSDDPSPATASFAVSLAMFDRHLDQVVEGEHHALSVSQLVDTLARREPLPSRPVVITFDDGFADTLEVAAPRLLSRRLPATVYLTTGYLAGDGRRPAAHAPGRMVPWTRVEELEAAGLEVGAHTHTHPQLDVLPRDSADDEIRRSKYLLEAHLGHQVLSFAYPHGYADGFIRRKVRQAGFDSACGVRNAFSHPLDDRWFIARLTVRADTPIERLVSWLEGRGARLAPAGEPVQTRVWRSVRRLRPFTRDRDRFSAPAA
jgi:peptidoglycan/xylan/chitin deacetylase (PgdA/CDA1 family)